METSTVFATLALASPALWVLACIIGLIRARVWQEVDGMMCVRPVYGLTLIASCFLTSCYIVGSW